MPKLTETERALLCALLDSSEEKNEFVSAKRFRADNSSEMDTIDDLVRKRCIIQEQERYRVSVAALAPLDTPVARLLLERSEKIWAECKRHYQTHLDTAIPFRTLADLCDLDFRDAQRALTYMLEIPWLGGWGGSADCIYETLTPSETVLKFETFTECVSSLTTWGTSPHPFAAINLFSDSNDDFRPRPKAEPASIVLPSWIQKTPSRVQALVLEIYEAKNINLLALPAMGIRAVIDAVSFDVFKEDIGSFANKLARLRDEGHVTTVQHAALAAVVNAGNAAAHRAFIPDMDSVNVMLDALNHLLQSIYVLEPSSRELSAKTPTRQK